MLFHSIILGIVQGLTEFLPVSSSAHLALLEQVFDLQNKLQLTVFLHFGSVIAIIIAMRKEIKEIFTLQSRRSFQLRLLIIGSIPAGATGLLFSSKIAQVFESLTSIGICLVITGVLLWLSSVSGLQKPITPIRAFIIGIAQAIAILPGISRSGITISTGIYLGIDRSEAAKFSFLLAIISILGATIYEIISHYSLFSIQDLAFSITGIIFSFLTSYLAIKWMLKLVKTKMFPFFSVYCWILGFIILAIV